MYHIVLLRRKRTSKNYKRKWPLLRGAAGGRWSGKGCRQVLGERLGQLPTWVTGSLSPKETPGQGKKCMPQSHPMKEQENEDIYTQFPSTTGWKPFPGDVNSPGSLLGQKSPPQFHKKDPSGAEMWITELGSPREHPAMAAPGRI